MPLLSRNTWLRIQQKLNQENAGNPPALGPNKVTTWNPVLVRANSATAVGGSDVGDQCYDASVLLINSLVDDQEVGADVWLTVLDEAGVASAPAEGLVYLGLYAGRFDPGDDSRLRVFASPIGASSSGSGSSCGLAVLKPTDCVKFTNSFDGSTHYGTNTGAGVWTSDDDLDYPGGSGPAVLTYAAGAVSLTVDGIAMLPCGNGCWSGGPLTGHADDTEVDPCDGETFTVCVSCSCCPIDGWDGPGWYCVREAGSSDPCEPVELVEDDKCDDTIEICSGPYVDEAEALAVCPPLVPGATCVGATVVTPGTTISYTIPPGFGNDQYWRFNVTTGQPICFRFLSASPASSDLVISIYRSDIPCNGGLGSVDGADALGDYPFVANQTQAAVLVQVVNNGAVPISYSFTVDSGAC